MKNFLKVLAWILIGLCIAWFITSLQEYNEKAKSSMKAQEYSSYLENNIENELTLSLLKMNFAKHISDWIPFSEAKLMIEKEMLQMELD